MANSIGNGALILTIDQVQLEAGLKKAVGEINAFQTQLGSGVSIGGTGAFSGITAGVKMAMGQAKEFVRGIEEAGDRAKGLLNSAEAFGVPVQQFQALSNAAKLTGVDMGAVEKAFKHLDNASTSAILGDAEAINKLKSIGLNPDDFIGKDSLQRFDVARKGINAIADPMERLKAMGELFGEKAGFKMAPVMGDDFQQKMKDQVSSQSVLSRPELEQLKASANAWEQSGLVWQAVMDRMKASGGMIDLANDLSEAALKLEQAFIMGKGVANNLLDDFNQGTGANVSWGGIAKGAVTHGIGGLLGINSSTVDTMTSLFGTATSDGSAVSKAGASAKQPVISKADQDAADAMNTLQTAQTKDYDAALQANKSSMMQFIGSANMMGATFNMGASEAKAFELSLKDVANKGMAEATIAAGKLTDQLTMAKSLIGQNSLDLLGKQLESLDKAARTVTANGSLAISGTDKNVAAFNIGKGLIQQAGLNEPAKNLEATVAGSNEDVRARIMNRNNPQEDMAQLVARSIQTIAETRERESENGAAILVELREGNRLQKELAAKLEIESR